MARFPFRYHPLLAPLAALVGLGRRRTGVELTAGDVDVRLGWLLRMRIPRSDVGSVSRERRSVCIELDPPLPCRVVGIPGHLTLVHVSLEDPAGFLAAFRAGRPTGATPIAACTPPGG